MSKKVLILSSSPRRNGNSDLLCNEFMRGAAEAGHQVEKIFLRDKHINYCTGCSVCSMYGKPCPQKDDAAEVVEKMIAADVIVMDYKPFTPFSDANIDGHMLFGMEGKNCRTTIINGKVLYKDREFVGIDEDKINAFCMEQSKKLWGELNHRTY